MNCVTHGLGIVLGTVGQYLLNKQVIGQPLHYTLSCAVYSASVITLYTSSTLYHSFFALRRTKFIFKVFDSCAIYLLIAGSYTPFLMIGLHHKPSLSARLLLFIWGCAISGILVAAFFPTWKHKSKFSLAMYLGMGWTCMVCVPDLLEVLPMNAVSLLVAGGVSYTGGV
jgi:hemolysin III